MFHFESKNQYLNFLADVLKNDAKLIQNVARLFFIESGVVTEYLVGLDMDCH